MYIKSNIKYIKIKMTYFAFRLFSVLVPSVSKLILNYLHGWFTQIKLVSKGSVV